MTINTRNVLMASALVAASSVGMGTIGNAVPMGLRPTQPLRHSLSKRARRLLYVMKQQKRPGNKLAKKAARGKLGLRS